MRKGGSAVCLPSETFDEGLVIGVASSQDLQSDVPIQELVVGQVDLGHTSTAQPFD
jgi:hypothetical protein